VRAQREQRRKRRREIRTVELEDVLGAREILEPVRAEIAQRGPGR